MAAQPDEVVTAVRVKLQHLIDPERFLILEEHVLSLQELLNRLLFESGEFLLHSVETKQVDAARKKHFNQAIDLTEKCLLLVNCAQKKIKFLEKLLDPTASDIDVQARVEYDQVVDGVLHLTWFQVQQIILGDQNPALRCLIPENLLSVVNEYRQTFTQPDL